MPPDTAQAIVDDNASARINGLRAALSVLALLALLALAATRTAADQTTGRRTRLQPDELVGGEELRPAAG